MAEIAEGIPALNTSGVDAGTAVLLGSVYGQQLLTSLTAFIQHIVQPDVEATETGVNVAEGSSALHDSKLIDALATFVREAVSLTRTSKLVQDNMQSIQCEVEHKTDLSLSNRISLSRASTHTMSDNFRAALNYTKERIEKIVYNDMPIRLLAFDENGREIRLIERNEVVWHIMDCAPEQLDILMAQYNDGVNPKISLRILRDYFASRAKYAILSHTWIRDIPSDVIYTEWSRREQNTLGMEKITGFCKVSAVGHGITLAWMDTVCINKNSSSELDESIGSMYKWYRNSAVCVVYLSEVDTVEQMHTDSWFKRGWTLQELLAPTKVEFYDQHWKRILAQADNTLAELPLLPTAEERILQEIEIASSITKREIALCRGGRPFAIPIGRKMQMAIGRRVTRAEDSVYSLMGLLGVKISISYGEGEKSAFNHMLRELINTQKSILDIFNCGYSDELLPNSLDAYQKRHTLWDNAEDYGPASWLDAWKPFEPITITHLGCRIPLLLAPALWTESFNPKPPPYGDFYGTTALINGEKRPTPLGPLAGRFDILCGRIYTDKEVTTRTKNDFYDKECHYVVTYGIINFGFDEGVIRLPDRCLATVLSFGIKRPGRIDPSDTASHSGPLACLSLYSLSGNSREIRKEDLGKHGLQLVTMHL